MSGFARIWSWTRRRLFPGPLGTVMTLTLAVMMVWALVPLIDWAVIDAHFAGADRSACVGEGACWVFIRLRLAQFVYGFYPEGARWRVDLAFVLFIGLVGGVIGGRRHRGLFAGLLFVVYPWLAWDLLAGGVAGLAPVPSEKWGGLMLTLTAAVAGMLGSAPLGVGLALARRSKLPVVRLLAIAFIELWRGLPLIAVLFVASVMLPLFLPGGFVPDKLVRALIGMTLFTSAYVAEVVRGGLQAIPKGQYEAARALGLSYTQMTVRVILPQALRLVVPGLVNTFVSLFKDSTLLLIIGLFDLLGIVQAAATDPAWLGHAREGYIFAGAVFWAFCFALSRLGRRFEVTAGGGRS